VDAAFWQAQIVTGEDGKAVVKFKMPDNLTTWRATVKGVTAMTDIGETEDKVITRKNLLVRMETPRFFREGDEVTISTIIHNYLNEKKKTKISFKADSLSLVSSKINTPGYSTMMYDEAAGMYELNINSNSELRIDWRVKVTAPFGNASLTAEALTDEESDALKLSVPLLPKGYKEVNVLSADFADPNKEETLEFKIPEGVDLRSAGFSFSAAPSLAGTMLKALDELVEYPYGCVEQTMSRFLPAVIAAKTFKSLGISPKSETLDKLPKVVDAGLKKLYEFQHSDGGWGWWKNDESQPYMTAYVVYGLSLAMYAGYEIDRNIVIRGIDNLKSQVKKNNKKIDKTTLSYIAYAMSVSMHNNDDRDFVENLLSDLKKEKEAQEPYSLALLTLASENTGNKKMSSDYRAKLLGKVNEEKNFAFWGGQQFHYRWQDDKVQGTAFALKALLKTGGDIKLADKAVKWLLRQKHGFSWNSTQETASIIFALADYLKVTKETSPQFTAEVYVNGEKAFDKSFTSANVFDEPALIKINSSTTAALKNGVNTVRIIKHGEGKLYFSGMNEYYSKERVTPVRDNSYRVKREYYILRPENEKGRIIYHKEKLQGKVKSGDNILVKTYVTSRNDDMQYFMLEDMFPSGFEIVKDADSFRIEGENDYSYWGGGHHYRPWRWFYADKEYRDEKASFFVTNTRDEMVFTYILKAQMPGRYSIMPATGSLMYYPEINGSGSMENVEVTE
jgi:uncharacterized protein YfaS (alpha-2-macroglobulin family)